MSPQGARSARQIAWRLCAALLCGSVLTSCHHHAANEAQVRLIDAVPDAPSVRIGIFGTSQQTRLTFGQERPYATMPVGAYRTDCAAEQSDAPPCPMPVRSIVLAEKRYTILAAGSTEGNPSPALSVFEEPPSDYPLKSDQCLVRVVNAVPDAGQIDLLFNNLVMYKNLPFDRLSYAVALPATRYDCIVKTAGDRFTPLCSPKPLQLRGGKTYLLVVLGRSRDGSVSVAAYDE